MLDQSTPNLVIGTGIAGLSLALKLAESQDVLLIAKGTFYDSNSWYAQGGIASVQSEEDSFASHVADTLEAGAGLCHLDMVKTIVEGGPKAIADLAKWGVQFTTSDRNRSPEGFHLTREGGHSFRRIMHAEDATGREIIRALMARVKTEPRIRILENQFAVDLLVTDKYSRTFGPNRCLGAFVMDRKTRKVYQIRSGKTFLCTGGHGKAYLYTSNPDSATGDGLAMGHRAGCKVANLEFMQFHPTCLFHPESKTLLISEALRGEGAVLKDFRGHAFMAAYHPSASLAPRDIVARAIDAELKKSGRTHVFLDARPLGAEKIKTAFPNIYSACLKYGIDITTTMIPVVPAAHYSCGGLVIDQDGKTSVAHLFAIGEVACSGLHGANRLASNSLLEAVVLADRAAAAATAMDVTDEPCEIPPWNEGRAAEPDELVMVSHAWDELRRLMWNYVGIVRSDLRLKRAYQRITALESDVNEYFWDYRLTEEILEVRNLAHVSLLTVRSAMARKESRGIHYNIDYPQPSQTPKDTILW